MNPLTFQWRRGRNDLVLSWVYRHHPENAQAWSKEKKSILRPNSWTKSRKKVLRVFLTAIQSHLYRFALRFLFLQTQTHTTSYSFYSVLLYIVKEKRRKPNGLKKFIQKPQVWELSRLCPETLEKLYVHELSFWWIHSILSGNAWVWLKGICHGPDSWVDLLHPTHSLAWFIETIGFFFMSLPLLSTNCSTQVYTAHCTIM